MNFRGIIIHNIFLDIAKDDENYSHCSGYRIRKGKNAKNSSWGLLKNYLGEMTYNLFGIILCIYLYKYIKINKKRKKRLCLKSINIRIFRWTRIV